MTKKITRERISSEQFHALTRPLIGLSVSRTWQGYGTAIFFELGDLVERKHTRKDGSTRITHWGQATVDLEIGWRVERLRSVYFGSSSEDKRISNCLNKLQGLEVVNVTVQGRLPEIVVQLSGGFWLQSFSTWEGQPEWALFFNENAETRSWIESRRGNIVLCTQEDVPQS